MDLLIVVAIVVIAVGYLYRHMKGLVKQDGGQFRCSGGCGGCPSNGCAGDSAKDRMPK